MSRSIARRLPGSTLLRLRLPLPPLLGAVLGLLAGPALSPGPAGAPEASLGGGAVLLHAQEAPEATVPVADLSPDDSLPTDPKVTVGELGNGLRYYIRENPEPENRAELRLVVSAGSVLEDDDQLGLAHFVEHMAFNGTEHFEKQELVAYLERVGMRFGPGVNAYTSFDETVYMLRIPTDSAPVVDTAFRILEDWATGQTFEPEEIDKERGVIIEEWRGGRGAGARMRDEQFPVLFRGSKYADRLPIGDPEVIRGFEYATLERFYDDWYRPDLMAVVAVGDFDGGEIEKRIRERFAGIGGPADPRPRIRYEVPGHEETLFAIATDPEATGTSIAIYHKHPPEERGTVGDFRRVLMERLYNGMLNARLREIVQRPDPPFLGASSGKGRFIGSKEVYYLGAGVEEGGIARGLEALLTEARRVDLHGFTPTELEREKASLLRSLEQAYAEREKTDSRRYASEYIGHFLVGEPIPGIAAEYALAERFVPGIELEEVNELGREWITEENRVVLVSAPEKEESPVPAGDELEEVFERVAAAGVEPYVDEVADRPLVAEVPEPAAVVSEETIPEVGVERWELANGVEVLLKPTDFKDDEILVRAWSPGGSSLVSDADYPRVRMASTVVQEGGVGAFSRVQLRKELAGKAVRVGPSIGSLSEGMSGSASPDDVETLFQLIHLYFTAPRKDSAAFLSLRQRFRAILENRSASPEVAWMDTLSVTLAQHHPRAKPMSPERIDELELDASYDFYRDRFADASDFAFVFVGAFDPDSLRPLVRRYLGGLPSTGRGETWRDVGIDYPEGVIERTVRKGLEPKSRTRIVFTGEAEWSREEDHALSSLADVLAIRFRDVLREDEGGTYGVRVGGGIDRAPDHEYSFRVEFGTDPARMEELVGLLFEEIEKVKEEGPTGDEVARVKEQLRRSRETSLRENRYWLSALTDAVRWDEDPREILERDRLIERLDRELLRETARRYLRTDGYVRVTLLPEEGGGS